MKYIIDIPDDHTDLKIFYTDADLKIIQSMRCEPHTEPDRKAIEDEVWEFLIKCLKMDGNDFYEIFGSCDALCLTNLSHQEAKEKYDAWRKQKDEICVGDEVIYHGNKYVVGYVGADEVYHIVDRNWIRVVVQGDYQIFKTGRHFPEVAELLKKMREE